MWKNKSKTDSNENSRRRGGLRTVLRVGLLVFLAAVIAGLAAFANYFKIDEWHSFDSSLITDADSSTIFYDADGNEIAIMHSSDNRIPISIETLPDYVKYAFISAEDSRFYEHGGIDIVRIGGAALADLKAGEKVQGASTIGQQLIKLSHLSPDKTFERKLEEAYLSIQMEHEFSKDEILEMYLNYVYFGGGYYGVEAAARGYFGIHASELSIAQSAQLAGIVKAPSRYAPHLNMEKSLGRRSVILGLMRDYGRITEAEYSEAMDEECILCNDSEFNGSFFLDYAIKECCKILGVDRNELLCGGYSVYTTLDSDVDVIVNQIVNSEESYPDGAENAEGALVLMRNDGSIAALTGGREYTPGCFNRATDMERQPGSLIKPVICYAPAMEYYGVTAASILDDIPKDFSGYAPRNAGNKYEGRVSVRTALANSLNIPAVELLDFIGIETGVAFAERMGVSFDDEQLSLALALGGFTYGVSPLEMAGAYGVFASGGEYNPPYSILSINKRDENVYRYERSAKRVLSMENAFIMTDILSSAVEEGTARALADTGLHIAAKTGTNLDSDGGVRDAWTAAYTADYTAIMWMGTDNASLGTLPPGTTGGSSACEVLGCLFSKLYDGENTNFKIPNGVTSVSIDKGSIDCADNNELLLATEYTPEADVKKEYFALETVPASANPFWEYPQPPEQVGWYFDLSGKPVITFTSDDERYLYSICRIDKFQNELCIVVLNNCIGPVEYRDASAMPGNSYTYYIRKIHPNLAENGINFESEPSRYMHVIMNSREITIMDYED